VKNKNKGLSSSENGANQGSKNGTNSEQKSGAPSEAPPAVPQAAEDGGFTLLGEAETPAASGDAAAYVGDVQEPTDDNVMGFAAAPPAGDEGDMGFAAAAPPPPVADDDDDDFFGGVSAPEPAGDAPIVLGPPPTEDAPIVLAPPPVEETGAVFVEDAEDEDPPVPTEPSAIKKFNEEFQELIKVRMAEEDAAKSKMEAAAKLALEEFQAKRETMHEARLAKNREDEQAKLEDIEADMENDNSWQRVNKMVDMTQDGPSNGDDTTRMRDVFITLKNEDGLSAKVGA
jgi:hypothetical protein